MNTRCDGCGDETRVPRDYKAGQRVLCDDCRREGASVDAPAIDDAKAAAEVERRAEARIERREEMRRDEAEWRLERGY